MKVRNVGSNMTELETDGCTVLFSYETPVAARLADPDNGDRIVITSTKWSATTTRHIKKWVGPIAILMGETAERPQEFFDNLIGEV